MARVSDVVGWALIAGAAALAIRMNLLDRRMQQFRAPDMPATAYFFVPVRWRRHLYTPDGQELVGKAWRTMALMYAVGLVGAAFLSAPR